MLSIYIDIIDLGVFTELIAGMGCHGVQMEEIWSLDEVTMEELK
jgi:ubiquitin carboxyl-terminal hydrolase L5